jgi:hypothetical protein
LPILLNIQGEAVARQVGVREILKHQGFSRPLSRGSSFKKIGVLRYPNASYDIYYYEYNNPANMHGRHALVVIRNGWRYIGSYEADDPCFVKDIRIICDNYRQDDIIFKNGAPPNKLFVQGYERDFYK